MLIKTYLSNIASISPRAIGFLIIIGGWEPIYQILKLFHLVGDDFNGFFIILAVVLSVAVFLFDYVKLRFKARRNLK
ncbi:hypothetical protein [Colwellia piezophila]|uniref:hypothetical protein n=1 Tax=Colwellia piezophila TaxID=211668 RepID=UPI000382F021|nr:hypothetical protein [Colwellia piezophila]